MTVAENIKRLRKKQGFTQKQLAEKCGMSESTLRQYEIGYRNPKIETLHKIAKALDKSIILLVEGCEDKYPLSAKDYQLDLENSVTDTEKECVLVHNPENEKDIEKLLDSTLEQLLSQDGLMFDGDPATPEAIDAILSAMRIGMEMAKKKNKEKYTPKKYKKD